jgi:hypothetical protein
MYPPLLFIFKGVCAGATLWIAPTFSLLKYRLKLIFYAKVCGSPVKFPFIPFITGIIGTYPILIVFTIFIISGGTFPWIP